MGAIISRVETQKVTMPSANAQFDVALAAAVDTTQAFVLIDVVNTSAADTVGEVYTRAEFFDASTVRLTRATAGGDLHVVVTVVEFSAGVRVQHLPLAEHGATYTHDVAIPTAVDLDRTFVIVSQSNPAANSGWMTAGGVASLGTLFDASTVRLEKHANSGTNTVAVQVIEFT